MQLRIIQKSFTILKRILNLLERKCIYAVKISKLHQTHYLKNMQMVYQINLQIAY